MNPANVFDQIRELTKSKATEDEMVATCMSDGEGRNVVAQAMVATVRARLDPEDPMHSWGWTRRVIAPVRPDHEVVAPRGFVLAAAFPCTGEMLTIRDDGQGIDLRETGRIAVPPVFRLVSCPTLDAGTRMEIDRATDTVTQELALEEDKRLMALFSHASRKNHLPVNKHFSLDTLERLKNDLERRRLEVGAFSLNRRDILDFNPYVKKSIGFEVVTDRDAVLHGVFAMYKGIPLLTACGRGLEEVVPAGTLVATAKERLGGFGISRAIYNDRMPEVLGPKTWAFAEELSLCLTDVLAVGVARKQ
jgi:hypothetical protein